MRKTLSFMAGAIALTSGTAVQAQHHLNDHRDNRRGGFEARRNTPDTGFRGWKRGDRFDSSRARNYQELDYRRYRHLKAPPRGYHYVRSGNDAVLVAVATGIVAAIVANAVR